MALRLCRYGHRLNLAVMGDHHHVTAVVHEHISAVRMGDDGSGLAVDHGALVLGIAPGRAGDAAHLHEVAEAAIIGRLIIAPCAGARLGWRPGAVQHWRKALDRHFIGANVWHRHGLGYCCAGNDARLFMSKIISVLTLGLLTMKR